jgi:hypothetical protein
MAVTRTQSISVHLALRQAIIHRLDPKLEESSKHEKFEKLTWNIPSKHYEYLHTVYEEVSRSSNYTDAILEMFIEVESFFHQRKIRKNAVVQEFVIAYEKNAEITIDDIEKDVELFFALLSAKYASSHFGVAMIHSDHRGKYHVHILFSLRDLSTGKKIRWNFRAYFDIVKKLSRHSPRISLPTEDKGIGPYPLWLIRKIQTIFGLEEAEKIVSDARKKGLTSYELYEQMKPYFEKQKRQEKQEQLEEKKKQQEKEQFEENDGIYVRKITFE